MLMYVIKNKNCSSMTCMCRTHISMAGVTNIAIFFTNQNVTKFEHEMNTPYENIYHQESICGADYNGTISVASAGTPAHICCLVGIPNI
jgi:hypothetical protein